MNATISRLYEIEKMSQDEFEKTSVKAANEFITARLQRQRLGDTLTKDQMRLLEDYESECDSLSERKERESFMRGFKLGVRIVIEGMIDK